MLEGIMGHDLVESMIILDKLREGDLIFEKKVDAILIHIRSSSILNTNL